MLAEIDWHRENGKDMKQQKQTNKQINIYLKTITTSIFMYIKQCVSDGTFCWKHVEMLIIRFKRLNFLDISTFCTSN